MPRSPTNVTVPPPKWPTTFFTCEATVLGSEVLPANTSIDKGIPAWSHNRPMTICMFPDLPSRLLAKGSQVIVASLQIAACDVVEKKRRFFATVQHLKKPCFSSMLMCCEPGKIRIKIILIESIQL